MSDVNSKRAEGFSESDTVEVRIAANAGACFGVVRAIKLGNQALGKATSSPVVSLGPLIHNPKVVGDFETRGMRAIQDAADIPTGSTVILRSHGVRKEIEGGLKERGMTLVDATCPLVKKPQRIATSLGEKGYFLVLVGDKKHPEVQGVLSYFGRPDFLVTYNPDDISQIPPTVERVAVLAQTTIEYRVFEAVVARCKERFSDVVGYNTICDATSVRQREAEALARGADVVVVVGGRNSSNTLKLAKICRDHQPMTYLIEEMSEIDRAWFDGKRKIGVTGGASTPMEFVDSVGDYIARLLGPASA
jgi:4-hydroxy-3-methylbut-2-enyl diphosphate reductase